MHTVITTEIREVMQAVQNIPTVSIILPFEPKMKLKTALILSLKNVADKVEQQIQDNHPGDEMGNIVMQKLKGIIRELNFNTHKKSIAIYVSPMFEKVLYINVEVEEKIIVDGSFEIWDLVYNKK